MIAGGEARSQSLPPDVVKLPAGIDLGGSSFYDGFGKTTPGWVFLDYVRWNHFNAIKDDKGNNSLLFVKPRVEAFSNLFHIVYISPINVPDGAIAFEVLLPVVGFDSHFDQPGTVLHDNGWNVGDLTFGVDYQFKPLAFGAASVLSMRAGLDFIAPLGGFNGDRDFNQSSGFWSITPYLAVSVLPRPKWEISTRISYDYNFSTTRGADPAPVPGFTFRNGQAGEASWLNFASSYEVWNGIRPGINGYWLRQWTGDKTNGVNVPSSKVEALYLGPGLSVQIDPQKVVNFNVYLPASVTNSLSGPEFNIQYVGQF